MKPHGEDCRGCCDCQPLEDCKWGHSCRGCGETVRHGVDRCERPCLL
jgi:hypothetical protein